MLGRIGLVLIAAALAFTAIAVISDPVAAQQPVTPDDIAVRDGLIAQQESLLNVYRCRFDIDTQIVPGGCTDGKPAHAEPSDQASSGPYTAVSAGSRHACALKTDQTVACWGNDDYRQTEAPDGQFTAIAAGDEHVCALRADQTVACWGDNRYSQANAPTGQFDAISAGAWQTCGLRIDATITCWGNNSGELTKAPEGQFTAVSAGSAFVCALRTDATIACWGNNGNGQADAPEGQFTALAAGSRHTCALTTNTVIACWGDNSWGQTEVPFMQFTSVSAGQQHSCALRTDQTIACWGHGGRLADSPDGPFTAVAVGDRFSCGLRTDQAIACWDLTPTVSASSGVRHADRADRPDPAMCRQQGVSSGTTAGFPLPSWAPAATGTVRVAVLFLDFPDTIATYTTYEEAELGLPYAEKYLESVSYGQLDIEFVPLHKWLRAEQNHTDYLEEATLSDRLKLVGIDQVAARLADPEFDFTGIDVVLVVMPSSHFSRASAGGRVDTEEGPMAPVSRINITPISDETRKPRSWGDAAAHELGHNLGLADLYAYDDSHDLPDPPVGQAWADLTFGLMGLNAYFLAGPRDPRLAYVWHHPTGHTSTEYSLFATAREMLAWSRWQLGWLRASQIRCVTEQEATVTLRPIAAEPAKDAIAMAAIPLSGTRAIVIESRRKTGYDSGRFHRTPDGFYTTFPGLSVEGVLVYSVNSALGSGRMPIKVFGDTGNGQVDDYPILTQGQSITIDGYTITVQSSTPTADTVIIAKSDSA